MSVESNRSVNEGEKEEHAWIEQIEIAASELVDRTKELIEEGNVRRLIIRNQDDDVLLEVPLTTGVAVGGVVTLIAPVLAALGAMAAAATCRGRLIHNAAHDLASGPSSATSRKESSSTRCSSASCCTPGPLCRRSRRVEPPMLWIRWPTRV